MHSPLIEYIAKGTKIQNSEDVVGYVIFFGTLRNVIFTGDLYYLFQVTHPKSQNLELHTIITQ